MFMHDKPLNCTVLVGAPGSRPAGRKLTLIGGPNGELTTVRP